MGHNNGYHGHHGCLSLMFWRRRRSYIQGALFCLVLLLIHLSSSSAPSASKLREYGYRKLELLAHNNPAPARLTLEGLLSPSRPIVRTYNEATKGFDPEYTYSHQLGRGFEGQADVYVSATYQTVVVKTFFATTREEDAPPEVMERLKREHNITITKWPVDISATLRRYNGRLNNTKADLTVHAIDAFCVERNGSIDLPWKMVLPLYACGSLDSATAALSFLNVSTADVDFLYRPRYRSIFEALGRMHTTAEPSQNATGFCHDDVKIDNLFMRNEAHEMLLGDMGQTRPLNHFWHQTWRDCRLVDAHRAWKTYLVLLRDASARNNGASEFDRQLWGRSADWAKAYWNWKENDLTLPQDMVTLATADDMEVENKFEAMALARFWDTKPRQSAINFPVFQDGRIQRVAMERNQALQKLEVIRREYESFKTARTAGTAGDWRPWWWWDQPSIVANENVDTELKVIDGAQLVGLPGT